MYSLDRRHRRRLFHLVRHHRQLRWLLLFQEPKILLRVYPLDLLLQLYQLFHLIQLHHWLHQHLQHHQYHQ